MLHILWQVLDNIGNFDLALLTTCASVIFDERGLKSNSEDAAKLANEKATAADSAAGKAVEGKRKGKNTGRNFWRRVCGTPPEDLK